MVATLDQTISTFSSTEQPLVLVVDDEPALQESIAYSLRREGWRVEIARDGVEAIRMNRELDPDLIVLDVMLPGLSGYDVCKQLRSKNIRVPILMLTAKGQEQDIVLGLNLGADDYVTKPFRIGELVARVNAFLRRRNQTLTEIYRFGEFELDRARHKLFRDGHEVELTAKEFGLLTCFLERQGCALTREHILNAVWGHSIIVTERSVDRCVTTLRAKIGARYIQTVRDLGYRFEPGGESDQMEVLQT